MYIPYFLEPPQYLVIGICFASGKTWIFCKYLKDMSNCLYLSWVMIRWLKLFGRASIEGVSLSSLSSCYRESGLYQHSNSSVFDVSSFTSWLQLLRELLIGSTGSAALEPQPETLKYTLRNLPSDPGTPASCLEHQPFGRQDHADEGSRNAIKHECTRACIECMLHLRA
jgi:hypothetical protein